MHLIKAQHKKFQTTSFRLIHMIRMVSQMHEANDKMFAPENKKQDTKKQNSKYMVQTLWRNRPSGAQQWLMSPGHKTCFLCTKRDIRHLLLTSNWEGNKDWSLVKTHLQFSIIVLYSKIRMVTWSQVDHMTSQLYNSNDTVVSTTAVRWSYSIRHFTVFLGFAFVCAWQ